MKAKQNFGGSWTEDKLNCLSAYLEAYLRALKKQPFQLFYIDAFAGTGYREQGSPEDQFPDLLELFTDKDSNAFVEGSARIALKIEPSFDKYVFIEKKAKNVSELARLLEDFPSKRSKVEIIHGDANIEIRRMCTRNWIREHSRAVMFLDPFGMQVEWSTIEAVAKTRAIDLWILFPGPIGVNRMLTQSGNIDVAWRRRLDLMFGTSDWHERFYQRTDQTDLFGNVPNKFEKTADVSTIGNFFIERLKTIFAGVVTEPFALRTPTRRPLYLLCFAAGNPNGAKIAVRIAKDIMMKRLQ